MNRIPLVALFPLLLMAGCGGTPKIDRELKALKEMGSPLTLEEMGIPKGRVIHPDREKLIQAAGELKSIRKDTEALYKLSNNLPTGSGWKALVYQRQDVDWKVMKETAERLRPCLNKFPGPLPAGEHYELPDYSQGPLTKLDLLSPALDYAKTRARLAYVEIHEGKTGEAARGVATARTTVRSMIQGDLLIERLVLVSVDGLLAEVTREILEHPKCKLEDVSVLETAWAVSTTPEDIRRTWRMERVCFWPWFRKIYQGDKHLIDNFYTSMGGGSALNGVLWKWCGWLFSDSDGEAYLRSFRRLEVSLGEWCRTGDHRTVRQTTRSIEAEINGWDSWGRCGHLLTSLAMPAVLNAQDTFVLGMTQEQLVRTAVALKHYQLKNRELPADLEPLIPGYLSLVPVDWMDGYPLRYHKTASGGFLLYSVGLDGVDDGGDGHSVAVVAGKPDYRPKSVKDILWLRTSEATR
ncbi:MAG: hypothetical protein SFU85_11735 [Candidatus Methylacidiphilales bacterium]|nr:hypothetical protein [Candidatus Methylacidiphilales bacterium]